MPEVVVELRLMVLVESVAVRPDEAAAESETVPVNPLRPLTVIVLLPLVVPLGGEIVDGLALSAKSVTWTLTIALWLGVFGRPVALPVTRTV